VPLTRGPTYESILTQHGVYAAGVTAATSWFDVAGVRTTSGTGTAAARPQLVWSTTDWPGYTVMNLQVSVTATATQTGLTYTFGLYPVANTGTTTIIPTLGTVVSGSTVAFSAPAAASETRGNSADFALPAADLYMIGCVGSGTTTASSEVGFTAILRVA
jgi:hypothetical protein